MSTLTIVLYALSLFFTLISTSAGLINGARQRRKLSKGDGVSFDEFNNLIKYVKSQAANQLWISASVGLGAALGFIATIVALP